jgi:hypothetical protein
LYNKKAFFVDEEDFVSKTRDYKYRLKRDETQGGNWRSLPVSAKQELFSKQGIKIAFLAVVFQAFAAGLIFISSYYFLGIEVSSKIGLASFVAGLILMLIGYMVVNFSRHKRACGGFSAKPRTNFEKLFLPPGSIVNKKPTKVNVAIGFETREFKSHKADFYYAESSFDGKQIKADEKLKKIANMASSRC